MDTESACDGCGKVYNPYLGHRFWAGEWTIDGIEFNTLCDRCHRSLVRRRN